MRIASEPRGEIAYQADRLFADHFDVIGLVCCGPCMWLCIRLSKWCVCVFLFLCMYMEEDLKGQEEVR